MMISSFAEHCQGDDKDNKTGDATDSFTLTFVKSLRAVVVNCGPARAKCHDKRLYSSLIQQLFSVLDKSTTKSDSTGDDKSSSEAAAAGFFANEVITTLCAVCMNDETNTSLLKEVLQEGYGNNVNSMKEKIVAAQLSSNEELMKRVNFLMALME